MRRRHRIEYEETTSFSPWETCSDLYCGLLLVFILLFFFAIYQYIDARERNAADTAALQEDMKAEQASVLALYKADLEDRTSLLDEQQQVIDEQTSQLSEQQALVEEQKSQLSEQQARVEEQKSRLSEQQTLLEAQQSQLSEKQALLEEQQSQLSEQQKLLEEQSSQIEQIVGIKGQLITALNQKLTENQIQLQADPSTGAITVEDTILFASNSNELRTEGKEFFREFMPVYLNVLLQPEFREYIAEIIIEGHTDQNGSYLYNLELSQQRAWSVAEYFFDEKSEFLNADVMETLQSLITVNGCSYKNPVYKQDGSVDADKSRRVEIKFRLKDQEMIQEMDEILNN